MNSLHTGLAAVLMATAFAIGFGASGDTFAHHASHAGHHAEHHGNHDQAMRRMQAREFRNLRQGRGTGMGRLADDAGYPGPMHALEHADALKLTDDQIERSRDLMTRVRTRAPEIGRQIVAAEKRLEAMFADGAVDPAAMDSLLNEIAGLRARLRSLHLTAHLDQATVLTSAQIEQYKALRSAEAADGERRPMRRMRQMKRDGPGGDNRGDNGGDNR